MNFKKRSFITQVSSVAKCVHFRCSVPSVWNSLPVSVIGSDSISVFKSRLKHSYFLDPSTSTHIRLPPAPLKLRPYGALQICLLLLFRSPTSTKPQA